MVVTPDWLSARSCECLGRCWPGVGQVLACRRGRAVNLTVEIRCGLAPGWVLAVQSTSATYGYYSSADGHVGGDGRVGKTFVVGRGRGGSWSYHGTASRPTEAKGGAGIMELSALQNVTADGGPLPCGPVQVARGPCCY
jgi:hypothetical protein